MSEINDVAYWLDKISALEVETHALFARNINLIADNNTLQSQLAATQARLSAFEEGYDPVEKLPKDYRVVYIKTENETKVSRLYPASVPGLIGRDCFEDLEGKEDEIRDVVRWFPLPGSKEAK